MIHLSEYLMTSAVWGTLFTIASFALATWVQKKTRQPLCNPLLLATIFMIVFLKITAVPYQDYKTSSSLINYLLLPATVSLAVPLYEKWQLLKENIGAIFAGLLSGVFASLGSILAIAKIMQLSREQYITLLPKSVTTAIGMDVASELGGIAALSGAVIILTGIAGNLMAQSICRIFHIDHPIARGIGIGSASHAIGTTKAMEMGPTEGAMSSLAIAVAGILTAFLAPVFADLL